MEEAAAEITMHRRGPNTHFKVSFPWNIEGRHSARRL